MFADNFNESQQIDKWLAFRRESDYWWDFTIEELLADARQLKKMLIELAEALENSEA